MLLEGISEVARVQVLPGDVIVVRSESVFSEKTLLRMKAQVQQFFPANKVMVLAPELSLEVYELVDGALTEEDAGGR